MNDNFRRPEGTDFKGYDYDKICGSCGAVVARSAHKCPNCGSQYATINQWFPKMFGIALVFLLFIPFVVDCSNRILGN